MVLDQAVSFLTRGWKTGPLDLRDTLIIVPTRHAGRRLRERLASVAAQRNTAVLIGPVKTPAFLFSPEQDPSRPTASDVLAEAFWRRTLAACDPARLAALGPASIAGSPAGRASTAEHLHRLRSALCEEGYDLRSFAARVEDEKERWACLAALEDAFLDQLRKTAWQDDVTFKLQSAARPVLPPGLSRITVLFTPDPPPLALRALVALEKSIPVTVCVHALPSEADAFDAWGRPLPEAWQNLPLAIEASQVEVCDDAIAMAELAGRRVLEIPASERAGVTIGIGDRRTAARLADSLTRRGLPCFDPAGAPLASLPLFTLINRLFEFRRDRTYRSFMNLARHPAALARLESVARAPHELLATLDEFQNQQMPVGFQDACDLAARFQPDVRDERVRGMLAARVATTLQEARRWLGLLDGDAPGEPVPLSQALPATLAHIHEGTAADASLHEQVQHLRPALEKLAQIESISGDRNDHIDLLQRFLNTQETQPERATDAMELLGWLELAWDDAPVMLLADLNDGLVPETITSDPFLPDTLRCRTGLRDNRFRLARDAHTLQSVLRSRKRGNVRGFMPRRSPSGDPLKPSRLLLQCPADQLAQRALYFFSDAPSPFRSATRGPGWPVNPPLPGAGQKLRSVSPTSLKTYLECPFKFYLRHVLRMDDPYEDRSELDPLEFGNLCHTVFKSFAESGFKDSAAAGEIADFLKQQVEAEFANRFGANLTVPLLIQRDIILQRMRYAAAVQAQLRSEGWRIIASELDFEVSLEGLTLRGRFDRVDRNDADGRLRIIDYKTNARADEPEYAHRRKLTAASSAPAYARTGDGKWYWRDLQLPLYVHAYRATHPKERGAIETAYFALPNAVAQTNLLPWKDMDEASVQGAVDCAAGIVRRIQAGVFWPPGVEAYRDDETFHALLFNNVERFLDPAAVAGFQRLAEAFERGAR